MPTRFHIGAKALRSNIGTYAKRFDFLEVKIAPSLREPSPSVSTLRSFAPGQTTGVDAPARNGAVRLCLADPISVGGFAPAPASP